ncbi:hypothetical protein [Brevibacillus parabrevis]|nr:hypothetical protein [Brevibacillus parabrevis]MED1722000.1 hypothetical protein [Brevibacillus parabrevis]
MRAEQLQKALATDADELRSLVGVPHETVAKKALPRWKRMSSTELR